VGKALILSVMLTTATLSHWRGLELPEDNQAFPAVIPEEMSYMAVHGIWGCKIICSTYSCMMDSCPDEPQ
jgi:hypothetical protein